MHRNFIDAGFRVFPLWPFAGDTCACDNPHCQAPGKHPRAANWQHTPEWDDDQIEAMELAGHFDSGYGVLCKGWLVVDVDARNGGLDSFTALCQAVPDVSSAELIVSTGSGGGSRHLYFSLPGEAVAMVQHLPEYPGLDFKTSGFVVGPGSRHVSGGMYSVGYGAPDQITEAPPALVDMLRKPDRHRAEYDGRVVDVSHGDIADMLSPIDPDCDYDTWIRIGMAVHHATGGTGFGLWDEWSQRGDKYETRGMDSHWHSFGRCANPVTLGTLVHHAESAGWQMPVTFTPEQSEMHVEPDAAPDGLPFDVSGVDLTSPPGFAGDLARWIEDQSRRPRKRLAVAGALTALGNVAGLRYTDDRDGVTCNLFTFCVAGSRTGKEAIQQAVATIHRAAGLAGATHGAIKSEQEIVRNLTRHQAALYVIDEIGIFLQKVKNAQVKGGALYLDGVIGMLMAAYSKADGFMLLTGDAKDDLRAALLKEAAQLQKRLDDGDNSPYAAKRVAQIETALDGLDNGLERPFLSLTGFTTPVTFDELVDYQSATNGFIGRALMFVERETAPRSKRGFRKRAMP
ncbi:bifunctional DNA primase/polymerase, partial [Yoonia sp.]|uniref:bifunctional DNA primase/polymerase n=1 Tax=Yoonia sp. TaxID=2212373 RepID=UPI002E090719|nr:bifunctional DNA primase/polymerase [Yoonia sp.]